MVFLVVVASPADNEPNIRNVLVIQRGPPDITLRPVPYGAKILTDATQQNILMQLDMHRHCRPFQLRDEPNRKSMNGGPKSIEYWRKSHQKPPFFSWVISTAKWEVSRAVALVGMMQHLRILEENTYGVYVPNMVCSSLPHGANTIVGPVLLFVAHEVLFPDWTTLQLMKNA